MQVKFTPNDRGNPVGKLTDAALVFTDGPLEGLTLIGFAIWTCRTGGGLNVTFPAREYSVNAERRSFALLRPMGGDLTASARIRDLILAAWAEYEAAAVDVPVLPGVAPAVLDVPAVAVVPFALSSEPATVTAVQDDLFSGGVL